MINPKLDLQDFSVDIDVHFKELDLNLARLKYDNNRNFILSKTIDSLRNDLKLINDLALKTPKYYMNFIHDRMKVIFNRDNSMEGFWLKLKFFEKAHDEKLGFLQYTIDENNLKFDL